MFDRAFVLSLVLVYYIVPMPLISHTRYRSVAKGSGLCDRSNDQARLSLISIETPIFKQPVEGAA